MTRATQSRAAPLAQAPAGAHVRVAGLDAGHALQSRLLGMGLVPGVDLRVLRNDFHGPMVVAVRHGRLGLGRGMAARILVV